MHDVTSVKHNKENNISLIVVKAIMYLVKTIIYLVKPFERIKSCNCSFGPENEGTSGQNIKTLRNSNLSLKHMIQSNLKHMIKSNLNI